MNTFNSTPAIPATHLLPSSKSAVTITEMAVAEEFVGSPLTAWVGTHWGAGELPRIGTLNSVAPSSPPLPH